MGLYPRVIDRRGMKVLKKRKAPQRRLWALFMLVVLVASGVAFHQVRAWIVQPQALFVLGGDPKREAFAAEFAQQHPDLPVWVSSGSPAEYSEWLFSEWGIAQERVHLDYQAVDTVTNFTSLVEQFEQQNINSVYLVTSDYHMRRAQTIGLIVLGSRGIEFQPLIVPTGRSPEPWGKVIRDGARSIFWLVTGHTGASLGERYRSE